MGADYVIPCWVEKMTQAEAAEKFDIFNSESKKPTPYDHYKVGIAYGEPYQTAIKRALDRLGSSAGRPRATATASPGSGGARRLQARDRRRVQGSTRTSTNETNGGARPRTGSGRSCRSCATRTRTRRARRRHDAGRSSACARSTASSDAVRKHLVNLIGSPRRRWRSIAQGIIGASGSQGGSVSRANFIATSWRTEHNRSAPGGAELHVALLDDSTLVGA